MIAMEPVGWGKTVWVAAVLIVASCSGTSREMPEPPEYDPGPQQAKCKVRKSVDKPLIVEWPSAERAELEATVKTQLAVVRYDGCEIQLLSQCNAPGAYRYTAVSPKTDGVEIKTEDDLYATIPIGAARLEGVLAASGQLNVTMTIVGHLSAVPGSVSFDQLSGACNGATHVVAALTVGAFEFYSGARSGAGAGVSIGPSAGTDSTATRNTLSRDGDPAACDDPSAVEFPPARCSALLRLQVELLLPASARAPQPTPSPSGYPQPTGYDQYGNPIYGPPGVRKVPPSELALRCQNDFTCGTHRCDHQSGRCAFPCTNAETDCGRGMGCMAGLCVPGSPVK